MKFVFAAVICFVFLELAFSSPLDEEAVDRNLESFLLKRAGNCIADGQRCAKDSDRCCSASKIGRGCPKSGRCNTCIKRYQQCNEFGPNCCGGSFCSMGSTMETCQKCARINDDCGLGIGDIPCCSDGFCLIERGQHNGKCIKCIADGESCTKNSIRAGCCPGSYCVTKEGDDSYTCQFSPNGR